MVLFSFPKERLRAAALFLFSPFWYEYSFSFFSLHNNNNNNSNTNNNNNNYNNNSNNNNRSIIIPYTSVYSHSSLYAFALNVIINTYFSKGNTSPAA